MIFEFLSYLFHSNLARLLILANIQSSTRTNLVWERGWLVELGYNNITLSGNLYPVGITHHLPVLGGVSLPKLPFES